MSAPPAAISWLHNGILFVAGEQVLESYGEEREGKAIRRISKLSFTTGQDSDGLYQCMATNPLSLTVVYSGTALLNNTILPFMPYIIKPLTDSVIAEGRSFYLDCLMAGWPIPVVTWQVNKTRVQNDTRWTSWPNGTLLLRSVTRTDHPGSYLCTGKNSVGVISPRAINITVAYLDAIFVEEPTSKTVFLGSNADLKCIPPSSYPPANISWLKNEKILTERTGTYAVIYDYSSNSLKFSRIQYPDNDLYACQATNAFAPNTLRVSRTAELLVEGMPEIVEPPTSCAVVLRGLLWLVCIVRGNPSPTVYWYKDTSLLNTSSRVITSNSDQELTLLGFNLIDVGKYSCRASNAYGSVASTEAIVTLLVPPEVSTFLVNTTVLQNQSAFLTCKFYAQPSASTSWFKDEFAIAPGSSRFTIQSEGLAIMNVTQEDGGIYKCCATNEAGMRCQAAFLDVQVPPSITNISKDLTVNASQTVLLFCQFSGNPQPQITWFFNNDMSLSVGIQVWSVGNASYLEITKCFSNHTGQYSCLARNYAGSTLKNVQLFVREKPKLASLQPVIEIIQGQNLMLNCSIELGNPFPDITWLKNNATVLKSTSDLRIVVASRTSILIKFVTQDDEGRYSCVAENGIGSDVTTTLVLVIVPPDPPTHVSVVSVSTTSFNLTWQVSTTTPTETVMQYVLQIKQRYVDAFVTYNDNISTSHLWLEVTDLVPGNFYWIRLARKNRAGSGTFSTPVGVSTVFTAPSVPRNIQLLESNSTSALISWEIPEQFDSEINIYVFQHRPKYPAGSEYTIINVPPGPGTLQKLVVFPLKSLTTYECKVKASTLVGGRQLDSQFTSSYFFATKLAPPARCPLNIEITFNSSTLVLILWKVLPDLIGNDLLNGFILSYASLIQRISNIVNFTSEETRIYLENMKPWTNYTLKINSFNEAGVANCSNDRVFTTPPIAPTGPPVNVQVVLTTLLVLSVSWQEVAPVDRTCQISGYFVSFGSDEDTVTSQVTSRNVNITGLVPNKNYTVEVRAFCEGVGFGPYSTAISVTTPSRGYITTQKSTSPTSTFRSTSEQTSQNVSRSATTLPINTTYYSTLKSALPSSAPPPAHDNIAGVIIGVSVGGVSVVVFMVLLIFCCCRKTTTSEDEEEETPDKLYYLHPYLNESSDFFSGPNRVNDDQWIDSKSNSFWGQDVLYERYSE